MIVIEEKKSKKIPSVTSLFLTLTFYNKDTFDILVQSQNSVFDNKTKTFEFPINRLYFLVNQLRKHDDVKFIPYKEEVKDTVSCENYKFKVKPFKHQLDAVEFGANHMGWLLLDDQGLGKTCSMIYLAEVLRKREGLSHCFIICGVNSLKYNWESEIAKFSDLPCRILGKKITRNGKVRISSVSERCKELRAGIKEFFVITNIETLQSKDFADSFNKSRSTFDMIVLDEAHRCKNPSAISAKTLMRLKAKRCIALTGTVIMNNPENAYIPLKWTGNTSCNYSQFKRMFNVYGGFGGVQVIGYKNLELLQQLLSNCSLRRLKSQVLDLPDKTYITDYVEMKPEQRKLYDEVEGGLAVELNKLDHIPSVMEEITLNMRLRQITAFPGILSTATSQSAKLDRLEELVSDIVSQGDKVVVFNTFKGAVEEEAKRLSQYNPLVCVGGVDDAVIAENKRIFETNNDNKVMLCTWQKMGTGHTLTAANYVIFVDTPWTDSDVQQSADRIYRIGQNKKVFIITLITKDSYDERVKQIVDRKECLSGYLVDNKDKSILDIYNNI